jgi:hypothetical protein
MWLGRAGCNDSEIQLRGGEQNEEAIGDVRQQGGVHGENRAGDLPAVGPTAAIRDGVARSGATYDTE